MTSFKNQIKKINSSGYLRTRSVINVEKNTKVNLNKKIVTSFLSNDYLGMSKNRTVITELQKSANTHGIGSGSSPLISGYSESHHYLEKEIAEYLNVEACLVVNSGYMANLCLMNIFDQQMNVIQDRESHNSIIESSKINKIKINRYKHLDNIHLEKYLDYKNRDIIFSESVFSMTGDITDIKEHYKLNDKQIEAITKKLGVDSVDVVLENNAWYMLEDGSIGPGIYKLKENKLLSKNLTEMAWRKDQVRIKEDCYSIGSVFGIPIYEALHIKTNQKIHVTVNELDK